MPLSLWAIPTLARQIPNISTTSSSNPALSTQHNGKNTNIHPMTPNIASADGAELVGCNNRNVFKSKASVDQASFLGGQRGNGRKRMFLLLHLRHF